MRYGIEGMKISSRKMLTMIILFSSTFIPFYLYRNSLLDIILETYFPSMKAISFGKTIFYFFGGLSQLIGIILSEKYSRKGIIFYWITIGILSNIIITYFHNQYNILFFIALLGFSFGFGLPSCFAFLVDHTKIEERGRVSSIVLVTYFFIFILSVFVTSYFKFQLIEYQILSIILRAFGYTTLLIDPYDKISGEIISIRKILKSKIFLIYLIPWSIFNISNGMLIFIENSIIKTTDLQSIEGMGIALRILGVCIFGLIAGLMADRSGRKQPLILGFIFLGFSYAFVGIATTSQSWLTMSALSGMGWGFVLVSYQWTILGDIASSGSIERYYALGLSVASFTEVFFSYVASQYVINISANVLASTLSIFLFISVLPLVLAPETLPENKIRDRKFNEYLKKVLQIVEKDKENK